MDLVTIVKSSGRRRRKEKRFSRCGGVDSRAISDACFMSPMANTATRPDSSPGSIHSSDLDGTVLNSQKPLETSKRSISHGGDASNGGILKCCHPSFQKIALPSLLFPPTSHINLMDWLA